MTEREARDLGALGAFGEEVRRRGLGLHRRRSPPALPFSVPPGLFIKKWILLQTDPRSFVRPTISTVLAYELADRSSEHVRISFDDPTSEWQQPCPTHQAR